METVELGCERRDSQTKGQVRALRRNGQVPAVLYGPNKATVTVAVIAADLKARVAAAARQRLIKLKSENSDLNDRHVIIKQVQRAPISGAIVHADFYEVDLNAKLRVFVALKFVGKPKGVAEGGILQPLIRQVEVECLPLEIPEFIEVDVTELDIHDVIHISAIKFSGNIKPIFDTDEAVVSVLPPTVEAAPVAAAGAEAAVEGAAPEAGAEGAPTAGAAPEGGKEAAAPAAGAKKAEGGAKKAEGGAKK
jgi:large subunit ribosomal protein L25